MRVVTFGELMLRLAPEGYLRLVQSERLCVSFGGAEANVAVSLASLGLEASFVSVLPAHELGDAALNSLRRYGVETGGVLRGGSRLGIYYCEKGASVRPSKVIYDRAGSSFSAIFGDEFDWDAIFSGADWFHFTGITPALSEGCAAATLAAVKAARERSIPVSCDLNYRKKLWSRERAAAVMGELLPYVDYVIANEEDAKDVFGISAEGSDIEGGRLEREGYVSVARQLSERFSLRGVAITLRESLSASDNRWSGMLYTKGAACFSRRYELHIVDRVGGGDSFGAGLIYSLLMGKSPDESIEFAAAAGAFKHTVEGDWNLATVAEIEALAAGNQSGRVQR